MMYVFIPFTGPLFLYLAPQNKITEMVNQKKKRNILQMQYIFQNLIIIII